MITYPTPNPEDALPPSRDIVAMVEANDDRLDGLIEDIARSIRTSTDVNEKRLKPVYQDLVYHIQGLVKLSDSNLVFVGSPLISTIKANVNAQGQILQPLLEEAIESLSEEDTETEPISLVRHEEVSHPQTIEEILDILNSRDSVDHTIPFEFVHNGIRYTQPPEGIICARGSAYNTETGLCDPIDPRKIVIVRREEEREDEEEAIPDGGMGTGEAAPEEEVVEVRPLPRPIPREERPEVPTESGDTASTISSPPRQTLSSTLSHPIDYSSVQFCAPNVCEQIEGRLSSLEIAITPIRPDDRGVFTRTFEYLANIGASAVNAIVDTVASVVPGNTIENMRATYLSSMSEELVLFHSTLNYLFTGNIGTIERPQVTATIAAKLGYANRLEEKTGIPISYLSTNLHYLYRYLNPQFLPTQDEIDSAYLHNEIDYPIWECWTKSLGNLPDCREPVLKAKSNKYTLDTLLRLYFRGLFNNEEEFRAYCQRIGYTDRKDIEINVRASEQLPTPSELLHYTIRDAFDPGKLGRKEMLEELSEQKDIRALFRAQGFEKFTARDDKGNVRTFDNLELAWISSYVDVSPTQSYEMLHRLRPNRVVLYKQHIPHKRPDELRTLLPGSDIVPDETGRGSYIIPKPVSMYEVAKNLKEHDYNPIWRDKLAAISYRVIGRIDLRRLYAEGVFGSPLGVQAFQINPDKTLTVMGEAEQELVERYLDYGYNETDSKLLAYYTAREYDKAKEQKRIRKIVPKLCRAYQIGILSKEDLILRLRNAFLQESQIREIVEQCELDFSVRITQEHIQAIKRMFLDGEIDENQAVKALSDIGIAIARIWDLLRLWRAKLRRLNRNLSVSTFCEWYAMGLIDRKEFENRLKNMKYSDDDIRRIIRHCELKEYAKSKRLQDRLMVAAIQREERDKMLRLRMAEKVKREQEREVKRRNVGKTLTNMRTWLKQGTMSPDEAYASLLDRGYPPEDAIRWIRSVIPEYSSELASTTKKDKADE